MNEQPEALELADDAAFGRGDMDVQTRLDIAAELRRLHTENELLREELSAVLADWNALVAAIGSRTNGGAVGHARALRAAARTALETLEYPWAAKPSGVAHAITALRAALK